MFSFILKKLRYARISQENENYEVTENETPVSDISKCLQDNLDNLKEILGESGDVIYREFSFGTKVQINAAIIYLEGLTDKNTISEIVMKPFMHDSKLFNMESSMIDLNVIKNNLLYAGNVQQASSMNSVVNSCLSGDTVLFVDGCKDVLIIQTRGWEKRGVDEPKTEVVVRGPREGFSETIATNLSLLRRKIKNPNLTFEAMQIGKQTKTDISLVYLKGIVNPKLIVEIKQRLGRINTDAILESGYIEQFIEDAPFSIFPTVGNSEKPDKVAANILEGRAAIFVDGTPFVLTVPMFFISGFQSAEDYYSRPYFASLIRALRFLCFAISILAPATYVLLSTFHQELIPTTLLLTMAAGREGVPFPAVLEAGLMLMTLEILKESGVRLPRPVGQAVSIVGALVVGEAAVTAGLVGGLLVVVVALTAIASFIVPVYTDATSILRVIFLILASTFGIFGISIGLLGVLIHLSSLRSFGSPYLSPLAPLTADGLKDSLIRAPLWTMLKRPRTIVGSNIKREESGLKPEPSDEED